MSNFENQNSNVITDYEISSISNDLFKGKCLN